MSKRETKNILIAVPLDQIEWLDNYHPELGRAAVIRTIIREKQQEEQDAK